MIIKLRLIRIGLTSLGFALKQTHSLSLLIILEAIILRLLLFLFRYLIGVGALSWFLVILTFAACEAALHPGHGGGGERRQQLRHGDKGHQRDRRQVRRTGGTWEI